VSSGDGERTPRDEGGHGKHDQGKSIRPLIGFRTKRQLWSYGGVGIETSSSADPQVVKGHLEPEGKSRKGKNAARHLSRTRKPRVQIQARPFPPAVSICSLGDPLLAVKANPVMAVLYP
jgi:hypothetical protein